MDVVDLIGIALNANPKAVQSNLKIVNEHAKKCKM